MPPNPACIGYASSGKLITPNLDRLPEAGSVFEAAYAASIPCVPSRGCLMTRCALPMAFEHTEYCEHRYSRTERVNKNKTPLG